MKTLITALIGLFSGAGFILLFLNINNKFEPNFNNIIIFGSNNTVNPLNDSRPLEPLPQPTVQTQSTPIPTESPKEISTVQEDSIDKTIVEPEITDTTVEQSSVASTKVPIIKNKSAQKYRTVSNSVNDSYPGSMDDDYQEAVILDEIVALVPSIENLQDLTSELRIQMTTMTQFF